MATPALLVPNTIAGKLYAQIPAICAGLADRAAQGFAQTDLRTHPEAGTQDLSRGARDHLESLLLHGPGALSLQAIADMGLEGFKAYWSSVKLFTWDQSIAPWDFEAWGGHRVPLPIQQRAPDAWSINPKFAFAYLGMARDLTGTARYIDEGGGICRAYWTPEFGIVFSGGVAWAIRASISYMVEQLTYNQNWQQTVTPAWQVDPVFLEPLSAEELAALEAAAYQDTSGE